MFSTPAAVGPLIVAGLAWLGMLEVVAMGVGFIIPGVAGLIMMLMNRHVAEGLHDRFNSIEEILNTHAATMKEILVVQKDIANSVGELARSVGEMNRSMGEMRESMGEMRESMGEMASAQKDMAATLGRIEDRMP